MISAIVIFSLFLIVIFYMVIYTKSNKIENKNVLIIGGSSGLGLEIGKFLKKKGNIITITSRKMKRLIPLKDKYNFKVMELDVTKKETFREKITHYDYIFCCAGISHPSYIANQSMNKFEKTIEINYLGVIRALKYYIVANKTPFNFIMIGSTVAFFTFPGYASYSPTKSALFSLFNTIRYELEKSDISLYILNPCSFTSPGYKHENKTKPGYTKNFEGLADINSPKETAKILLENMKYRRIVSCDLFTYLCQIRVECECIIDYFVFPISVVVVFFAKIYAKYKFRFVESCKPNITNV